MSGEAELADRLESIDSRLARLEGGFFGDTAIGHHGFVPRIEKIEGMAVEAEGIHRQIERHAEIKANEVREDARKARAQLAGTLAAIQSEWRRFKATAVGIGIGSGIVSAGSVFGILELLGRG